MSDLNFKPNVKGHAPASGSEAENQESNLKSANESTETKRDAGCVRRLVRAGSEKDIVHEIVSVAHPKSGQFIIRDRITKEPFDDGYNIQFIDTIRGYFVSLGDDRKPEIVFNDNLEIIGPE